MAETRGTASYHDARLARTRDRVLTATLELMTESGLGGLTLDDISRRSGVARTTIYRHWPDRNAIVVDACALMTDGDEPPPDTGSVEGDVRAILTELGDLLTTARWASIMPSIVDAAERDPQIAEVHARLQRWHAAPLRAALERAVERGEIAAGSDLDALAAALRGPLYFRRWFSREPVDAAFVDLVLGGVLGAARARPPVSRARARRSPSR